MAKESERVRLVRSIVESASGSRAPSAAELYTDDTRLFIPHGIDVGVYEGRDAVSRYWRDRFAIWVSWQAEIEWIVEIGESVQVAGTMLVESAVGIEDSWRMHYSAYFDGLRIAAAVYYADWMSPSQAQAG